MAQHTEFTHAGRRVEIVPSDPYQIIGRYWQFRIDGILRKIKSIVGSSEFRRGFLFPVLKAAFEKMRRLLIL
jgi:hypothetical protein